MDIVQGTVPKTPPESDPHKIMALHFPEAKSLGSESVQDAGPSTDDGVVQPIDEETPSLTGN